VEPSAQGLGPVADQGGTQVKRRWRPHVVFVAAAAVVLTACGGAASGADASTQEASGLPIAAAAAPAEEGSAGGSSASASGSEPAWVEPDDPVAAYRELVDKAVYMNAHPSIAMTREIYAPRSQMAAGQRDVIADMVERGIRVVGGRTVLEEVRLLSKDDDTAFLRIRSREQGWVTVDADGNRTAKPTQCERFVVELRDHGDGWRIATLTVDDKSFRRCEA
jgi:hypothetical protein